MIYSWMTSIYVTIWWKSLHECAMVYKKFVRQFQILQKNNSKIQILKLLKDKKILKNQMIQCLEIIETKQNIYD